MIATLSLLANSGNSQTLEQLKVTIELSHANLPTLFQQIQTQTGLTFAYTPGDVSAYSIDLVKATRSVKATLDLALKSTGLTYEQVERNVIISKAPVAVERAALIQGTVKDSQGQAMPGVNVIVKGTTSGTTTDGEGRFVIDAKESDVLVFSFIGFKPQEQVVGTRSMVEIVMEDDVESLKEVVVNGGYYQTTDKLKTGSIVRVAAKDIETQPVTSPLMALQGRMPGVDITPVAGVAGSAVKVQIRGLNSVRPNTGTNLDGNFPLYVIDGVPIDSSPLPAASNSLLGQGFDPLSTINPQNIESIEVLKDADATSIYGSRGANGVILITTKRGVKAGATNLTLNAYHGVGQVSNMMDLMNTQQYLTMRHEAFKNDNVLPGTGFQPDNDLLKWDTTRYADWQKVLIGGTAKITDMQATINGGNETTSFLLSGGFHKEGMVFPGDFGYRRTTGSFSLNHLAPNQKFRLTISLNYGGDRNNLFDDSNVLTSALTLPPNAPSLYKENGELNWEESTWTNPLAGQQRTHDAKTDNFVSNLALSYEIVKGLSGKVNLGYTDLNSVDFARYPVSSLDPKYAMYYTAAGGDGSNRRKSWIVEPQVNYGREIGGGQLDVVIGSTWQEGIYRSRLISSSGYSSDALIGNINAAGSTYFRRDDDNEYRYMAAFARIGYNFSNKYIVNLTGRRDGSSRFGPANRFANFGAAGLAWIITNESFVKDNLRFLSFAKLRSSYGSTGNDRIGDYKYYNTYSVTTRKYRNFSGLHPISLYNPNYAWEITRKLEAALEVGLLNNLVSAEVAWYRNRSSNQLVDAPLPMLTGFSSVLSNFDAVVENSGWEFSLRADIVKSEKIQWTSAVNFSLPTNKLIKFDNIENSPYAYNYVVGKPLSIIKLYSLKDVNSTTGLYEYVDTNSDGAVTSDHDMNYAQDLGRKYYGGITNTITYGPIEVSFLFQFSRQKALGVSSITPGYQGNQPVEVLDRWRQGGDVATYQMFTQQLFGDVVDRYNQYVTSSGLVKDASFIRLKTFTLSYVFSGSLASRLNLKNLRLYIQGQNLLTFTNFYGLDPETQFALPPLRMITAGIHVKI